MKDDRNHCADQQDVDQETSRMEDEESAQPQENKHQRQYKKHREPSFFSMEKLTLG
jgi:hypothetical protein